MFLSDASARYFRAKELDNYSPRTLDAYRLQHRLLIEAIGDLPVDEIATDHLRQYLSDATPGRKPATISHRIRALHSFFRWLLDEDHLAADPSRKIRERIDQNPLPKALSAEEFEFLRDACKTPREHAILEMFFATGARLTETATMLKERVNWDARSVIIFGKGRKEREVYFGVKAALWTKRYLAARTDDQPTVFVTARKPYRPMHAHTIYHEIKKIAQRAGMGHKVSPHTLRHTFATTLLDNGADITVIQSLLGHTKISTTQIYAKLSGRRRRMEYDRYFMQ